MSVLVVRIAAPLMSWGAESKYRDRHTRPDPTLSAVRGLLACAAGVERGQMLPAWVARGEIAVRIDDPGSILRDFHTVNPAEHRLYQWLSEKDRNRVRTVVRASGATRDEPVVTTRFYVQDATYTLFFVDPAGVAEDALTNPVFALFAGRKACPLTFPLVLGRFEGGLEDAVAEWPRQRAVPGALSAYFFHPPTSLPVVRTEDVYDDHDHRGYRVQRRFYTSVDPLVPEHLGCAEVEQ